MTKEEYEQCKIDQHSDDPYKAIQARFILAMFPTFETKHAYNSKEDLDAFTIKHTDALQNILGDFT